MLHYKVQWRARGNYPGHHPSLQRGGGLQFRNHVPLIDAPDPRRFDVRASLRDPFLQIQVRVYQQPSAIPVYVIADLSASMRFGGAASKAHRVAELVADLSYSAYRTGDPFGFIGCADSHTAPLFLALTARRAAGLEIAETLRATPPQGKSSEGLLKAANLLSARRALVFLVSDFHFSTPLLEQLLASLAYHDLVPVILRDRNEYENLPNFGLARVVDHETGQSRMLLMRPELKRQIQQKFAVRQKEQSSLFNQFGRRPLVLHDEFVPDEVTRYFFG